MAITASGLFQLTQEKFFIDTAGISLESETLVKLALITDAATPAFDTMDFYDDLSANEAAGSSTHQVLTGTELTIGSPAAGQMKYDANDASWTASTITSAMAAISYLEVGASSADMLLGCHDFVTAVSTSSGTLAVQWAANGLWYWDNTP